MKKSRTPLILVCVLVLLAILAVLFVKVIAWTHNASGMQREKYTPYVINLEAIENGDASMTDKEKILSVCERSGSDEDGTVYTSATLQNYLYDCRTIQKIYVTDDGVLYVRYLADEIGERITISYSDEGFERKECYNEASDTAYVLKDNVSKVYENYYNGFKLF